MTKIKAGDKITIRNQEFNILSEKKGKQTYYFLSQGARVLLQKAGITSLASPMRLCPKGHQTCREDEYQLANRFSSVPAVLIANNPIRSNSLVKLQEFIDYVVTVSDTVPETKEEKEKRKRDKQWKKLQKFEKKFGFAGDSFGGFRGHPFMGHPMERGPRFDLAELWSSNKKMKKQITALRERLEALENEVD